MQVAKDIPGKLINEITKSKMAGEATSDSMVDYISKTVKLLANPARKGLFLECLDAPREFDRNPKVLYHLRVLEDYGVVRHTDDGYIGTKFARELWNSIENLEIPTSVLPTRILLSLTSEPRKFTELKKKLKVNEGSLFRALSFLEKNRLITKKDNGYNPSPLANISSLNLLISKYEKLIENVSYDSDSGYITVPKEKEIEILDLFESERKNSIKSKLYMFEDLIRDHIIISYSYRSHLEPEEIIKQILKEQSGLTESRYAKPLHTFEKNMVKFGYNIEYITTLQQILNLLSLHDIPAFDSLMIDDIDFPKEFIKNFKGPKFGREGIRELLDVHDRPILQTVLLPEENLDIQTFKKLSKRLFTAGIDEMSDHRTMVENFQNFRERVETVAQLLDELKADFGQKIFYFHIYGEDYESRLDILKEMKDKGIGIGLAPLTLGFPLTSNITNRYKYPTLFGLILQVPFTRYAKRGISKEGELLSGFGISMKILLKFFVLLGGDEIHIDPPLYHQDKEWEIKIQSDILNYYFGSLKKPLPVLIGDVTSLSIPSLIKNYGSDIVLKFTTSKLKRAEKAGFSMERSINALKQAMEIATSKDKDITEKKYKDYFDSFRFYKKSL